MAVYTAILSNRSEKNSESKAEANVKKNCFEQTLTDDNLCPFKLQWSFGINPEAPVINLTTENRTLLAYACSHVAMIYDYDSRKMLSLQGHVGTRLPHGSEGMTAARISPDAKQIVTVGNEKCQNVYFWLWTNGRDTPDASVSLLDTTSERVKEIAFNDEYPEQFALTTDYHVLFLTWNGRDLNYNHPKVMAKIRHVGIFNGSCYAPSVQQVFTATTNGYILVWTNVSREDEHSISGLNDERKKHIKTVNLQNCSITVITTNKDMLVTGSSNGRISFYDYQLRLLYWCQSCDLDSIRWISFNLHPSLLVPMSADASENYDCQNDGKTEVTVASKLDINVEYIPQNYRSCNKTVDKITTEARYSPTEATLQNFPFNIQTFLACKTFIQLMNL
ncbi:cilia- and flagella-associated protein 251-like [Ooceraea biroi]|uniref:cilia- and flagella-associated protein 251-like n=1 Tax=Ooceraea biroi TaxID=2015173 RepID=UPI000F08D70F|nr:cilia- and flagella-associated protein 251-like [Ooceraea biroi]